MPLARVRATACVARARDADARRTRDSDVYFFLKTRCSTAPSARAKPWLAQSHRSRLADDGAQMMMRDDARK